MTLGQVRLIENYDSLMKKLQLVGEEIGLRKLGMMIRFCVFFQTDDIELFRQFASLHDGVSSMIDVDDFIELYAKRYGLDAQSDIKKIMDIFIDNAIYNGVSYHLNSSANFDSIMELGLGISAVGLKTPEREDYERLEKLVKPDIFRKLQPFRGEKDGSKLYYSNVPIFNARYGDRPEWLKELKLNSFVLEEYLEAKNLVDEVLRKYDSKYNDSKRMLFLIPNPASRISKEVINTFLKNNTPQVVISYFLNTVLSAKDMNTKEHIPASLIVAVDLENFAMYCKGESDKINKVVSGIKVGNDFKM